MNRSFFIPYPVVVFILFLLISFQLDLSTASGAELLPFPSSSRQSQQQFVEEPPYIATYREQVAPLTCAQLGQVRKGLLNKIDTNNRRDARYYFSLIEVIDQVKQDKNCPQQ